ncbi:hypothetical protein FGB62_53g015 [Gracilaria domingensis]|nr:hypothetical protein FGB62_53g015 [Gracilaria domingensis]
MGLAAGCFKQRRHYFLLFALLVFCVSYAHCEEIKTTDIAKRWTEVAGIRVGRDGFPRPYDVVYSRGNSLLSEQFKIIVKNFSLRQEDICDLSFDSRCSFAKESPGRIGELYYNFSVPSREIKGHSTQTLSACRCLDQFCENAIVVEPRILNRANGTKSFVCLYPRVGGLYRDCHTELFRFEKRSASDPSKSNSAHSSVTYGNDGF